MINIINTLCIYDIIIHHIGTTPTITLQGLSVVALLYLSVLFIFSS